MIERICDINPVTNIQGKGRCDFKYDLLVRCDEVLSSNDSSNQSLAVRKMAEQVKSTFQVFRMLIRKYGENIEVVDPMLRNNQELADVMNDLEKAWSLTKDQIMETERLL